MAARPSTNFLKFHVAVRLKDSIVVMNESASQTIWIYNLRTEQWRKYRINQGEYIPVNIHGHQDGVEIGRAIYIFGGYDVTMSVWKQQKSKLWKLTRCTQDSFDWNIIQIKDCTKTPSPRINHSTWDYDDENVDVWWLWCIASWLPQLSWRFFKRKEYNFS